MSVPGQVRRDGGVGGGPDAAGAVAVLAGGGSGLGLAVGVANRQSAAHLPVRIEDVAVGFAGLARAAVGVDGVAQIVAMVGAVDRYRPETDDADRVGAVRNGRNLAVVEIPLPREIRAVAVAFAEGHQLFLRAVVLHVQTPEIHVDDVVAESDLPGERRQIRCTEVVAGTDVLLRAVAGMHPGVDSEGHVLVHRAAEGDVQALRRLIGQFREHIRVPVEGRALAVEVNGAGDGVSAIQGALRAACHLNALDVEQVRRQPEGVDGVDAVDVDGHGQVRVQFARALRADAANGDALAVAALLQGRGPQLQPRHHLLQIEGIGHAEFLDHLFAERRQRQRHLERTLLPLFGRDDDLLDIGLVAGVFFRCGARRTDAYDRPQ